MNFTILLYGLGTGLGLWLILIAAIPRRAGLADTLHALRGHADTAETHDASPGLIARTGMRAVPTLRRLGLPSQSTERDLAALGRSSATILAEQAGMFVAGLLLPALFAAVLALGGIRVGWLVPGWLALGCAIGGFFVPVMAARSEAVKVRASFRHALSAYLDLVVVSLAGGAGVEEAMADAGSIGTGNGFAIIRHTLEQARLTRTPPWQALGRLGERIGVTEMAELAAAVGLAGSEGARVRSSLKARASALRARQLADTEAEAAAATERMSVPVVAFFAGFLLFLGYPAVVVVLTGL